LAMVGGDDLRALHYAAPARMMLILQ
jgi:hypothetical protein